MTIGFASDHRGYKLKTKLINYFTEQGYNIIDYGTNSEDSCDYPDFAYNLGEGIIKKEVDYGVAICGSGIGISIALNKINGIYCAKADTEEEAYHTRRDNNTNCISMGENKDIKDAIKIVDTFINTEFSNLEKHIRRINKVKDIEKGTYHA